ncbi:protein BROTHER of FT and TFL 1-like isoform X2 [Nymphaea colorata]|uniref:protein BROTHER of FT and TFL 1-like isoform X2 n=1 Tax=Nymphaea colorata TaxID=210225 RepID=UPI00129D609D|nr:protein BROTHER of FT and TFL 1-like isoform X2 [Nymphaea colorata]XP_031501432.1 protein BROTHER of FT and TFL 1-like isoform X2 [Nymphaea colorata]XP_049936641.1 protein BROTHER of FT and TFL 1-like isoform X2 [Nymphaea colorata]
MKDVLLTTWQAGVIGDVLRPFSPSIMMEVRYGSMTLMSGSAKKPSEVAMVPLVRIGGGISNGMLYTLIMVDPDHPSPSRPTQREQLLWLKTDIPAGLSSAFGNQVVEYMAPNPRLGIHRYVIMLFKQKQPLRMLERVPLSRDNFSTEAFTASLGMETAAAVFFSCGRERAPRSSSSYRIYGERVMEHG